jgi:hypothetical protein
MSQPRTDEEPTDANHGAWIPFLIRKRRFAEVIILAWQDVEDLVDQMTIKEFRLMLVPKKMDARVDLIRNNIGFQVKLKFLGDGGILSKTDLMTIQEFAKERNDLFHGDVFKHRPYLAITEVEKMRLMGLASKASQIALNRCVGVWYDEGTNDLGNKEIPNPFINRDATEGPA